MKSLIVTSSIAFILTAATAFAADYTCVGTEPFWGVKVEGSTLTYSSPEVPNGRAMKIKSVREAEGVPAGVATVIKTKCGKKHGVTLTVVKDAQCSDGMSDQKYTHAAVYDSSEAVLYGCCNLKHCSQTTSTPLDCSGASSKEGTEDRASDRPW